MSLHVRRQIVLAIVSALEGQTLAGGRVHHGRVDPESAATPRGPFLLVYARSEEIREISEDDDGPRQQRELTLAIEAVAVSDADDDSTLDLLALEIERALFAAGTLGGLAVDIALSRTDLNARADGESRTGRARLEFTVEYHTAAGRPDLPLE